MTVLPQRPVWRPEVIESAELAHAYRAALELSGLDIPPALGKQLANLKLRVSSELESRGIDVVNLTAEPPR